MEKVCKEKLPARKLQLCEAYFEFVKQCQNDQRFALVTVLLHGMAMHHDFMRCDDRNRDVDIYLSFMSLMEIYRGYSISSIYLQFTYWRIKQEKRGLKNLTGSIIKYIQAYFVDFDKDPDLQLQFPLDGMTIIQKLKVIGHWIEVITYHTEQMFEEYKKRKWLIPLDILVDNYPILPDFSNGELLKFRIIYEDEDDNTVCQLAVCNHRYAVWLKTTDVIQLYCEIIRMLYCSSDDMLRRYYTDKNEMLSLYDIVLRITDNYTGIVFAHKAFYKTQRQKFDGRIISEQEEIADSISCSIDDMLQITGSIVNDDIEDLLKAKQRYLARLEIFMTEDQERLLDEYMVKVVSKIKENIKQLDAFNALFSSITDEFKKYAHMLLQYPDIFSSLVSAEYLYRQYVMGKTPNAQFDYSCISIMYYMALEDFTNKLLYTSYATNVLDKNKRLVRNNYIPYVSHSSNFWDKKNKCYKKSCEIGNLGYLFCALPQETEYEKYLRHLYPSIDIPRLILFGDNLKTNIAPRRNDAAHGGNKITHQDACIDKQNVYNISANSYRGLVLELFGIVFPNL